MADRASRSAVAGNVANFPVGLNLSATVSSSEGLLTLEYVIRCILPFVLLSLGILALLIAFPQLALWLASTMSGR